MEVKNAPNSVEEPTLLYKLQRKIKVFNTVNPLPNRGYNLVSCASKYGLVFIASPSKTLSVYYLKEIIDKDCEPKCLRIQLLIQATHVAVNCNQEWLAVLGDQTLNIYKCQDFQNQAGGPAATLKFDVSPNTPVSAVQWNPCMPDTIGIVFFDGSLLIYQIPTMQVKKIKSNAKCLCWSPKGKQLVVGNGDGTLSQYKPDLTPTKVVPAPNLFEGNSVEVLAIFWISTYQFAVTYKNAMDNSRPAITIVNTPKAGEMTCINYDDICYSMGSNRPWYFYLQGIAQWNVILSSSSNSMEIATLASADGSNWVQWCQPDEARPELPLTNKQETYPVGVCVDTCAVHQLPWGEGELLPPMPLLHLLSHTGLLSIFNIVNLNKSSAQVCSPPAPLVLPAGILTSEIPDDAPQQPIVGTSPQPKPQPYQQEPYHQQVYQPQVYQQQPTQPQPIYPQSHQPQAYLQPQPVQSIPSQIPQVPPTRQIPPVAPQAPAALAQATPVPEASILTKTNPPPTPEIEQPAGPAIPKASSLPPLGTSTALTQQKTNILKSDAVQTNVTQTGVGQTSVIQKNVGETNVVQSPTMANPNALKAEQAKLNKAKVEEELKNMLIKEVNDFQMELYHFKKMTQEKMNKMQTDIQTFDISFNLHSFDVDKIRKDCDIEDLRESVRRLKLELVRACAVVAEARTHAEARDQFEWIQEDPLTAKRIATVKKLAYYVQNQMDQARRAFEHRYNEIEARKQHYKPGERMIRPVLEDIYQPLVRQQDILVKQAAILKSLRNTFDECTAQSPKFRSTSILRSTPFRNKDPLSKLTKNILNMSIEPEIKPKQVLSSQKLDALRDMLSNHTPVKIKPVHIDLRKHVETMKKRYEKSMKEKENVVEVKKEEPEQPSPAVHSVAVVQTPAPQLPVKLEVKPSPPKASPITIPTFAPMINVKPVKSIENVARTLFAEEPKPDPIKAAPVFIQPQVNTPAVVEQKQIAPPLQKPNILQNIAISEVKPFMPNKDTENTALAQNIQQTGPPSVNYSNTPPLTSQPNAFQNVPKIDVKPFTLSKDTENTFMGQKICSPTAFSFPIPTAENTFTAKPISDVTNMFSKFTSPSVPQSDQIATVNVKPDESNLKDSGVSWQELMKSTGFKPAANIALTPLAQAGSPPEVQKTTHSFVFGKTEYKTIPNPVEKQVENVKENISDVKKEVIQKEEIAKVIESNTGKPIDYSKIIIVDLKKNTSKPIDITPSTAANTTVSSSSKASSVIQPQIVFGSTTQPAASSEKPKTIEKPSSKPIPKSTFISKAETDLRSSATTPSPPGTTPSPPGTTPSPPGTNSSTDSLKSSGSTSGKNSENSAAPTQSSAFVAVSQPTSDNTESSSLAPSSVFAPTSTQSSIFSATTSASSIFASASASAFGTPTTQTSIFGANPPTTQATFGQATTTTSSVFGGTSPAKGLFSAAASNAFGTTATTAQNVFGTSTATTQPSVFGSKNQGSVFGTSNQTSVFGSPSSQGSIFGSATTQAQTSVFGSPVQSSQTSVFGSATPVQGSMFGTQTNQSSSVFGTPTTSGQSASPFGGGEANLFAAASISTTSAQSQNTGGNIFGSSSTVFGGGSNTNVFGTKAAFSGSSPSAANIFGGAAAATFGQKPANDFWSGGGNTNSGSAFGTSTFGQQATTQASSIFGGNTGGSFSTPSTGQPFGSPGPFSGGDSKSVFGTPQQQTGGFGASPVFGGSPAFGGKPSFGSPGFGGFNKSPSSGFGAAPAFGGGATFGSPAFGSTSPGKVFGTAAPGFGSPSQQSNPVFENLATQNSLTFGNLAQQSGPTQQAPPSFNTSPSFTGWRG